MILLLMVIIMIRMMMIVIVIIIMPFYLHVLYKCFPLSCSTEQKGKAQGT